MANSQTRKDEGDLSQAFQSNDLSKILQLTKCLPAKARGSLLSVVEVYRRRRSVGMTPLISAILHGNDPVAEMLIREKVDMGQALEKGFRRKLDIPEMVLFYNESNRQIQCGPNADIFPDYTLTTPMFWALKMNNLGLVDKILACPSFEKNSLIEKINGMTALMQAVLQNNIPGCRVILKHNVDLHVADFNGGKALDVAIDKELDNMIRFLITVGDSPNCTQHSYPPLIHAIVKGCTRVMEVLIEKGANVHKIALKGEQAVPLLYALSSQEFELAKLLVRKGADVNAQQTPSGLTALQVLASLKLEGQAADRLSSEIVEIAKFLVKRKADVEAVNSQKETVLFAAVSSMNLKLVKYLLSINAKVNVRNHCSQTPLHAAIVPFNATKAVVAMTSGAAISRHVGGGYTVNAPYIVPHQKEIVELLLKAGANLHSKDENLHTPLFLAVGNNNLEMAELLIERGAEVNGKNIDGLGLLHFAVKENNLHMVKCLVEIGKADLEISSKVGDTPLHIATCHKYHCIIQYLVDAKANVTAENCFHLSPLRMAVASDSSKLVKLLGKAGANCNSRTKDGSLLHFAIKYKHTKSVKSLLELGADVNVGDENKVSPFMVCILNLEYDSEFIQLLLDYGGDPLRPSKSGLTVYMCALARHEVDVLKVFWRFGCPTDELKIPHIYNALKKATGICSDKKSKFLQSPNSYLPFSERKMTKEEEDLRRAQTRFAEGIENNDAKQVVAAIENGAVARGVTHSMAYPLHYAVIKGYHDVVEVLLTNGVPVNFVDADRKTSLELAAFGSDLVMCQLLLSHGARFYPGLRGSVFSYKSITSQLEEGHVEFLLSTEKNKDKSVDICNMKRRLNKLEKRCEEASESREIRQIEKEIRKLKKDMYCCMRESTTEEKAVTNNVKSLKSLEKKLISCKSTLDLFFNIRRLFKIIRKQDSYSKKTAYLLLTKYLEANSTLPCTSVLNCLDNEGKTLMAAAIEAGNVEITEYIMNLRITDSKINTV